MKPLAVTAWGMRTSVGMDGPSTAAAVRCGISGAVETRFMDDGGEWMLGCPVPGELSNRGRDQIVDMAASSISECLSRVLGAKSHEVPLLVCLAERSRPGRLEGMDDWILTDVQAALKLKPNVGSAVFAEGRTGIVAALAAAERLLYDDGAPACVVAGADTLLLQQTIAELERRGRLLTSVNSNGFIPGEAGAAVLLTKPKKDSGDQLVVRGVGSGTEKATVESEEPLRADGLVEALRAAMKDAKVTFDQVDFRIVDSSGEQYAFKEAALAIGRTVRKVKAQFPIWHPADCIGEVGSAIGPLILGIALAAMRKGYAPGAGILCHVADDDGRRAALVLHHEEGGA
jgi:3-oxoacyl-[acyl-carrier-protein] synthase-1